MNRVLFLAANPKDTPQLGLAREVNEIDKVIQMARHRDQFDLEQRHAVKISELQGLLLRFEPRIVHFSGHGTPESALILEQEDGRAIVVPPDALTNLFRIVNTDKKNIQCVVLNACYAEEQAEAIGRHIPCVIGMSTTISDEAAIKFATSFYRALANGQSIKSAFELGLNDLDLQSIPEAGTPKLKYAPGVDPAKVILIKDTETATVSLSSLERNVRELLVDPRFGGRSLTIIKRRQRLSDNEAYDALEKLGATRIRGSNDDEEYWGLPKHVIKNLFEKSQFQKLSFRRIRSNFPELSDDQVRNILREMRAESFESDDGTELWKL